MPRQYRRLLGDEFWTGPFERVADQSM